MELVSAIITTHNRPPETVLRAVNSVLSQTYENMELIVVDDSTSEYSHRQDVENTVRGASDRILYIKHPTSRGANAARNTGLAYAKGYYVAFLDDDDEWSPNKIEEQLMGFTDNTIALVYCGMVIIDEKHNKRYEYNSSFNKGNVYKELLKENFIGSTSNPLIKRECIDRVGHFDIGFESAQDYDLWLRLAKKYPVSYVEKPLLNYHSHDNERISTNLDKQISGKEYINEKFFDDIKRDNKTWYMRNRALVRMYAQKKWKMKALLLWIRCVKKWPFDAIDHLKLLHFIVFGFDSIPYKIYKKAKDNHKTLTEKVNPCESDK